MRTQALPSIRLEIDAAEPVLPTSIAGSTFGVFAVLFIGMAALAAWSMTAPIATGAVAKGHVIVESRRKTISHLEGGIVQQIDVHDGEFVKAGQRLIQLDDARLRVSRAIYGDRWDQDRALIARLSAEQDGAAAIDFPLDLMLRAKTDEAVAQMLETQRRQFSVRRQTEQGKADILRQKIAELNEQIGGLQAGIASHTTQLSLIVEELNGVKELYAKGLAPKPRLLALQRTMADIEGTRAAQQAQIAADKVMIGEAEMQAIESKKNFAQDVAEQLRQTTVDRVDSQDRMAAIDEQMARLQIAAPIDGQVVGLAVHTVGGTISPGEKLLYVVPVTDRLVVDAEIAPNDIEHVRVGLPAEVRFSALRQRTTPTLEGTITSVSTDVTEEADQSRDRAAPPRDYYAARIEISHEQLERLAGAKLVAGMPADVLVKEGERTVLSYILAPIKDAIFRSFHEE